MKSRVVRADQPPVNAAPPSAGAWPSDRLAPWQAAQLAAYAARPAVAWSTVYGPAAGCCAAPTRRTDVERAATTAEPSTRWTVETRTSFLLEDTGCLFGWRWFRK